MSACAKTWLFQGVHQPDYMFGSSAYASHCLAWPGTMASLASVEPCSAGTLMLHRPGHVAGYLTTSVPMQRCLSSNQLPQGYSTGNPKKRTPGAALSTLSNFALCITTAVAAFTLLGA